MRSLSKLIILVFIAEIIIFLISAAIPYNSPSLVQQLNETEQSLMNKTYIGKAISIFANNIRVAILDFIPIIGIFFFVLSIVSTGIALSAESTVVYHLPGIIVALGILSFPHSFIELPSYAIATASGLYIIIRRDDWIRGIITFFIVPIELLLAALVEASLFYVPNPYIMWGVSAPLLVGLYFFYEYLQKVSDKYVKTYQLPQTSQQLPQLSSLDYQYFNQYRDNWAKAIAAETRGDLNSAINYLWASIIDLIIANAIRMGMPYYTKEDLDRVIQTLSVQNPQISYLYQQAFTERLQNNYLAFKTYATQLAAILQNIYQTSISRRMG